MTFNVRTLLQTLYDTAKTLLAQNNGRQAGGHISLSNRAPWLPLTTLRHHYIVLAKVRSTCIHTRCQTDNLDNIYKYVHVYTNNITMFHSQHFVWSRPHFPLVYIDAATTTSIVVVNIFFS